VLSNLWFAEKKYKLGASLQLECWNIGIMGSWIMQFWIEGKICVEDKTKNG
jgi:hypothetical protein